MKEYLGFNIPKIIRFWCKEHWQIVKYTIRYKYTNISEMRNTMTQKDTKKLKKAFVFGNGPSLKMLDPQKVKKYKEKGFDIFATHSYLISDFAKIVKPTHYVISDSDWIYPEKEKKGKFFAQEIIKNNEILNNMNIPLFLPINFKNKHKFKNPIFYFNDSQNSLGYYNRNITRNRPFSSITGFKALWIADFMGYDEIYICGMDTTQFREFTCDKNNNIIHKYEHFYNEKRTTDITFKKELSTGEYLYTCHVLFKDLDKFNSKDKIYNLDINSYVDAFSKNASLNIYKLDNTLEKIKKNNTCYLKDENE